MLRIHTIQAFELSKSVSQESNTRPVDIARDLTTERLSMTWESAHSDRSGVRRSPNRRQCARHRRFTNPKRLRDACRHFAVAARPSGGRPWQTVADGRRDPSRHRDPRRRHGTNRARRVRRTPGLGVHVDLIGDQHRAGMPGYERAYPIDLCRTRVRGWTHDEAGMGHRRRPPRSGLPPGLPIRDVGVGRPGRRHINIPKNALIILAFARVRIRDGRAVGGSAGFGGLLA